MKRQEIIGMIRKMSITSWAEWVNSSSSPNEGRVLVGRLSYPHYYLYFGFRRPLVVIGIYKGYFVPPPTWEPDWEKPQWKFVERYFSSRVGVEGLPLPSFLSSLSNFLTYIHEIFKIIDTHDADDYYTQIVREWMSLSTDKVRLPKLKKRGEENVRRRQSSKDLQEILVTQGEKGNP